ncbi:MAG TPA: hypothetical protein VF590_23680 [Isosphaeraceae bacterium]|jgi:hypothetical protein
MIGKARTLILAGVVGLGGLLGAGAATAKAQGYAFGGPGRGFSLSIGGPSGYPGYAPYPGIGYGRGYPGYGGGYGRGSYGSYYNPGSSYYYSQTTVTTIVYCNRCGHYHDRHAPCGGYGGGYPGGYPAPYPW